MNSKLPRVSAEEIIRVVKKLGFFLTRQSGSHKIYKNKEGKRLTIPYHKGKVIHPKIISSIMKDTGINADELRHLLK